MRKRSVIFIMVGLATSAFLGCASSRPPVANASATDPTTEQPPSHDQDKPYGDPATSSALNPQASEVGMNNMEPNSNNAVSAEPLANTGAKQVALSDGQIVKVMSTINAGEVEQAEVAQKRSTNKGVKLFAAHMISEHNAAKQKTVTLARKERIDAQETPVATDLSSDGAKTLDELKNCDDTHFDSTYVQAQIKQHQAVLDLLDQRLIPSAADDQLKASLQGAREMVSAHLTQAKDLEKTVPDTTMK